MNEEKIVKWFYDHEELLLEIMDKKPYQSDGWDYEIEIVKAFLAQQSNEQVEQRLELIGHADLAINNIYIFSGYGEEVPEGRTPIYAGYKNTHPPVPTAQPKEQEPVAYIHRNEYNEYRLEPHDNFDIKSIPFNIDVPLFKSPQRTWVGLTDEEELQLAGMTDKSRHWLVAAVEAKLKEKNT